ncbi:MAG: membrane protein insertion efficiency factor YidD [Betaproteobacteria bacterium]|nr:membrane protein insertion efficiency factor YidD [Betaproteobacteria bacterium]
MKEFYKALSSFPALLVLGLIRIYQRCISPALGPRCRFYPTCSEYAHLCIRRQGLLVGGARTAVRLCKCHPWHPGGLDFPYGDDPAEASTQNPSTCRKIIRAQ